MILHFLTLYPLLFFVLSSLVHVPQLRNAQLSPYQIKKMYYLQYTNLIFQHKCQIIQIYSILHEQFNYTQNYQNCIIKNKIDKQMNDIVVDKRIFMQAKKRSNTKTILPQIKYPLNFNMNGSSILRRINQQIMAPKENAFRQKSYQQPLSNILISKRITPIQPQDSPINLKKKHNYSYAPKEQSSKKLITGGEGNATAGEQLKRKTSTSLSQRIGRKNHERSIPHMQNQQNKNMKVCKTDELTFLIGRANNNQDLIRQILSQRKIWKQIKWGEGIPHLKWVFSKERHNYKKMLSFTQTRAINHFQFNEELTTKDNLIRNLQVYCQTKNKQIFTITPITFIVDFDDEYCEYNLKQFLSFFTKNDPRKNIQPARRSAISTYSFISKFTPFMSWQNSDIKKKVNILSRPVNNATYYSNEPEPGYIWLLKPTGLNRGRGIEIFDNLQSLEKMLMDFLATMNRKNYKENKQKNIRKTTRNQTCKAQTKLPNRDQNKLMKSQIKIQTKQKQGCQQYKQPGDEQTEDTNQNKFCRENFKLSSCSFVIQKYVERPFLIQKRKFDIRVWTLLTQNLNLYFFKQGYIRTSAQAFQVNDIDNYFIHLTNNAIQKNSSSYGMFENGNQLSFRDLSKTIGEEQTQKIWEKMKQIAHMAFSSVNKKINQNHRKFCFQIFGLDYIIDEQLKVWLIQINQNPCIECSSPLLGSLIPRMLNDAFRLTIDQIFTDKRPIQKTYPVQGYSNSQNMWQILGQLGPNAQYSPHKDIHKQNLKESNKVSSNKEIVITESARQLKEVTEIRQQESKEIEVNINNL